MAARQFLRALSLWLAIFTAGCASVAPWCDHKVVGTESEQLSQQLDLERIRISMFHQPGYEVSLSSGPNGPNGKWTMVTIARRFGNVAYSIEMTNVSGVTRVRFKGVEDCARLDRTIVNNVQRMIKDMPLSQEQRDELLLSQSHVRIVNSRGVRDAIGDAIGGWLFRLP